MSTATDAGVPSSPPRRAVPRPVPAPRVDRRLLLATIGIAVLATALRLYHLRSSYDLFIDEVVYKELSVTVLDGGFPRLVDGDLFFFHPPGFFYLSAVWLKVFTDGRDQINDLLALRAMNAVFAGISAACMVRLGARAGGLWAGVIAGLLFTVDPYALRQNGRVLLETVAMTWVLLGWVALLAATRAEGRRRTGLGVTAALLFGLALVTKDYSAAVSVIPLAAMLVLGWGLPRPLTSFLLWISLLPYAFYFGALGGQGHLTLFLDEKTSGVRRLLGLVQSTGFNSHESPSLVSTLVAQITTFGGTFALLALGALLALLALRSKRTELRLLGLFHLGAGGLLFYAVFFGTLEEQFLYLLMVPTSLSVAAMTVRLVTSRKETAKQAVALVALVALAFVVDVRSYVVIRHTPDDGYLRLLTYMRENVPRGTPVSVVDGAGEFTLRGDYPVGPWTTLSAARREGSKYAVVPLKETRQGYTFADVLDGSSDLLVGAVPVFSFDGPSHENITLYRLAT